MRRVLLFVVTVLVSCAFLAPAQAMTFGTGETRSGVKVVVASGEIKRGDARRLERALEGATVDKFGTKLLYLDSPGGLVAEALEMADIVEKTGVTVIVRKGDVCASACASILFVSGKYRTVETGGMLAIHSCYDTFTGRPATECNMIISEHAEALGFDGVAMMALHEAAGSDSLIVMDKDDAACFGLTRKPGSKQSKRTPPCIADMMKAMGQ